MNLKSLSLTVVVLALLAGLAAWLNRPTPPPDLDPRVGQPLLASGVANAADEITITSTDQTVILRRDGDQWRVSNFHDLPADLEKLRRLVRDLTTAQVERVITRDPARAARLELGTASIALKPAAGDTWQVTLGKSAERGGRYARLDASADAPAYLVQLSAFIDATPRTWAQTQLINLPADSVASLNLELADGTHFIVSRESAEAAWTATALPEGRTLRVSRIASTLSSLTGLRFNDTAAADDAEAADAAAHTRTHRLITFDGRTVSVTLARRPEQTTVKQPPADPVAAAADVASTATAPEDATALIDDLTETVPAGPVFARVEGPEATAPLASAGAALAFKVADFVFTGLPQTLEDLLEPAPDSADVETLPPDGSA